MYFIYYIITNTFRPLILPYSGLCSYYKNAKLQLCLTVSPSLCKSTKRYTTPSTHHLQPVPNGIPHCLRITYIQFQPIHHAIDTSPTNSSNRYTTPSAHHVQPFPTDIPHRLHITYNSSNRFTTLSSHHLHAAINVATSPHQHITPHTLKNCNFRNFNHYQI